MLPVTYTLAFFFNMTEASGIWELEQFKPLVEFVLDKNDEVLGFPVLGDLETVFSMYQDRLTNTNHILKQMDFNNFQSYVNSFNDITGGSLELEQNGSQGKRVVHIEKVKIYLFQDRLNGAPLKHISFKTSTKFHPDEAQKPTEWLLKALAGELGSHIEISSETSVGAVELYANKTQLKQLLEKPSALVLLSRQRAKSITARKPFHEVCKNSTHAKVLSNIFVSIDKCYQSIEQSQKLFSKGIYECSKSKTHFLPIIHSNTDIGLGDCSYLDTCHKMKSCRYLHYFTLVPKSKKKVDVQAELAMVKKNIAKSEYTVGFCFNEFFKPQLPAQWIRCDIRKLPFSVLGKFAAIISDPAWDIHMSLPYGTCSDEELMELPMNQLQDEGVMLLWVTGRSIEIGRKALVKWGYKVSDEIIWVKLNQLQRTIVTGRTGHWLNHSKEHLLVGLKGDPSWMSRSVDTNVIVSATRETSRKPDEVYDLVERLVGPSARKLEIFGRDHNIRPGWFTIGNQLTGVNIHEREISEKYTKYQQSLKHN
ncbi:MT-A70-domain-containing protein [Yamadazyma tenuis ATCC 10573]|uniref:mRNA m(6)A methyltransferase n=1 Tax=Candida tenuis (strain ATCC 10573 / BCRC 21748 / CBS 615 / JCM 9827 / NBRC 10315 / NRRL Y-1498 / VKM Y-70) TaxID=590646 RepID=G3BC51_CANTC|nr:MT-A70-domain-containing protein [Yamadazyma tenuis ATCC 10573]EGV60788.1 MT-A70-domain-containing protein [Yamadazyma tenuis ATCC 10573]